MLAIFDIEGTLNRSKPVAADARRLQVGCFCAGWICGTSIGTTEEAAA